MEDLMQGLMMILVPVSVTVVLPVMIVWLVTRCRINSDNKRAEIVQKAIEADNAIDADKLIEALSKTVRKPQELLNLRLLRGGMFSLVGIVLCLMYFLINEDIMLLCGGCLVAIGISYLLVYIVSRKQIKDNIESR